MSDKEQDVRTPDGADEHSACAPPENAFFATKENDSSSNSFLTSTEYSDHESEEETFSTPGYEKFLRWRQMDRSPIDDDSPCTSVRTMCDESPSKTSSCDESLIEQIDALSLFKPGSRASTSTPTKADDATKVERILERKDSREDLPTRDSRIKYTMTNARRSWIVYRDNISTGDETKDELTSDYSTMESNVLNNDGSSSKVTSDSSIDQLPPRETKQSDLSSLEDTIVDSAESTCLTDRSTASFIEDGEVFETDTFEELYSRNVELAQRYVERMMNKEQGRKQGGCFRRSWSKKFMNMSTLCRSSQRLKKWQEAQASSGIKTSSPMRQSTRSSEMDSLEQSPVFPKLRFIRTEREIQISERFNSGNARFTLAFHMVDR